MSEVWLIELEEAYAPSVKLGVYASEEDAKAARPNVEWRRNEDGTLSQDHHEEHLEPHWRGLKDTYTITRLATDTEFS